MLELDEKLEKFLSSRNIVPELFYFDESDASIKLNNYDYNWIENDGYFICEDRYFAIKKAELVALTDEFRKK